MGGKNIGTCKSERKKAVKGFKEHFPNATPKEFTAFATGFNKGFNLRINNYRKTARENLNHWCELCSTPKNLTIHHKDNNHKNNDLKNLQILCEKCHRELHHEKDN